MTTRRYYEKRIWGVNKVCITPRVKFLYKKDKLDIFVKKNSMITRDDLMTLGLGSHYTTSLERCGIRTNTIITQIDSNKWNIQLIKTDK